MPVCHEVLPTVRVRGRGACACRRSMSGTISTKEIATVMRHLGYQLSDAELERIVRTIDADGNGDIEFEEFLDFATRNESEPLDSLVRAVRA